MAKAHWTGKVVLITGSSSGIGASCARQLVEAGATVVINSVHSVTEGEALAKELGRASYCQADVSDEDQAKALVEHCIATHGRLDALVNNAGTTEVIPHHDLDALSPELFRRLFDTNVVGTWNVTHAAIDELRKQDGSIVNMGSIAGIRPTGSSIPYAVSKAALHHLTVLLAKVAGPQVRVNAVAPGLIETPWTQSWATLHELVSAAAPLKRTGQPEDVASVVIDLLEAEYVTGQVVVVDGGLTLVN